MLVKDYMTRHPVMIPPTTPAAEAQKIMSENKVRHLPVVGDGKRLLGLITRERLSLKPDQLASLNVWEISRYLTQLTVEMIMLNADKVFTIAQDRTMERAARIMGEERIGCLPVLEENDIVVGIITEVDLMRSYQDMLGLFAEGVRVTVRVPDRLGEFAKLTTAIAEHDWGIMGIGSFPTPRRPGYYDLVLKIRRVTMDEIKEVLDNIPDQEVVDIRDVV